MRVPVNDSAHLAIRRLDRRNRFSNADGLGCIGKKP